MAGLPTLFGPVVSLARVLDRAVEIVLARRERCDVCGRAVRPWQPGARVRGLRAHHKCAFTVLSSRASDRRPAPDGAQTVKLTLAPRTLTD
jgi:hypothetical protein